MPDVPTPEAQAEALSLADWLDQEWDAIGVPELQDVAAELRRMHALTSHAGADGWLPIEQVVPAKGKRMLLVVDCGPGTDAWVRTGYSYDADWLSDELRGQSLANYGYRVTHARPLPAPPADGKEAG